MRLYKGVFDSPRIEVENTAALGDFEPGYLTDYLRDQVGRAGW